MEQLIKISQEDTEFPVSARELHRKLKSETRFNDWIQRRIDQYDLIQLIDYRSRTQKRVSGGLLQEYDLSMDCAKELAMIENNEQGRKLRRYFIEMEKQARLLANPLQSIPTLEKGGRLFYHTRQCYAQLGQPYRQQQHAALIGAYPYEHARAHDGAWYLSQEQFFYLTALFQKVNNRQLMQQNRLALEARCVQLSLFKN